MTVRELIERLSTASQDAEVLVGFKSAVPGDDDMFEPVFSIEEGSAKVAIVGGQVWHA